MTTSLAFEQLRLHFLDPIQHDYEVVRPIVLFAQPVAERSAETGIARTTVGEKARRFVEQGMMGLAPQPRGGRPSHQYPEPVAAYILYLKQIYAPLTHSEIVRIVKRKFGYTTNHHTVKAFLERHPIPVQLEFDLPTFHTFEDAYLARWTVVRMYYEGWNKQSIAACLKVSRPHVHDLIDAFQADGFAGLEDHRTRPPDHPANQLTLPFTVEVWELQQEYPRAGRTRLQAILAQRWGPDTPSERTVGRAMALNRTYHDAPPWQEEEEEDNQPKRMPFRPQYRHHIWFIDIRYLVQLDGQWAYSMCILEGYSRKLVAGMVSLYQDQVAILQLLSAALTECGCPQLLVSDNGSVFQSQGYLSLLLTFHIQPAYIERGQPWQNLIEAQFRVQSRLADHHFEQAQSLEELQDCHAEFVELFNSTSHWAHRDREDGRRTPEAVLGWVRGRDLDVGELQRHLRHLQFVRTVNRYGFVSVQRFYIYAERGLARRRVAIWIYEGSLRMEYEQTLLARYRYRYDRATQRLTEVSQPTLYRTPFVSPQLELWEFDDKEWLKVRPRPYQVRHYPTLPAVEQLPLEGFALLAFLAPTLLLRLFST